MYNKWVTNKKGPWHRIESALSLQVNMYSEIINEIWKKQCREHKLSVSAIKGQFLRHSTHWAKSMSHSLSQGSHSGAPKETHQDSFSFWPFLLEFFAVWLHMTQTGQPFYHNNILPLPFCWISTPQLPLHSSCLLEGHTAPVIIRMIDSVSVCVLLLLERAREISVNGLQILVSALRTGQH